MSMLQASPDGIREKRKHRSKTISYEDGVTNWNGQVSIVRWLIVSMTCLFFIRGMVSASNSAEVAKAISAHSHVTQLFNGNDLSGFYTWLKESGRKDPNNVFSVKDGMIHISGEGYGYLATGNEYANYQLSVEYRWGNRTDGSGYVRNSGILLNAIGPDGGANGTWMTSIECQLAQGCEGDLIVIRGKDEAGNVIPATITSETVLASDGRTRWKKGGKMTWLVR